VTIRVISPDEASFLKAMIFGPEGGGKTHLIGTAQLDPRTSPLVVIDFEGGRQTLRGLPGVKVIPITESADLEAVIKYLRKNEKGFKSVAIDSLTEVNISSLLWSLDDTSFNRDDEDALTMRDYGKVLIQIRRFMRHLKNLPMHVFYIAGQEEVKAPKGKTVFKPMFEGSLAKEAPYIPDVVAHLSMEEYEVTVDGVKRKRRRRVLLLRDIPEYGIKVRTPWGVQAPATIENPTVGKLLDAVMPHTIITEKEQQTTEVETNSVRP
jgi:hypothetical protein